MSSVEAAETAQQSVSFTNPEFICSVAAGAPPPLCYVVFAGRSNAGKSSVINTLCGGRYARVAKTPGRTRLINLFRLGNKSSQIALADLPGYGYAAVSKQEQRGWAVRLARFLRTADICCLVLVLDCRRGIGELDERLINLYLPRQRPLLILLNKADKLPRQRQREIQSEVEAAFAGTRSVVLFSALKKTGLAALCAGINQCLPPSTHRIDDNTAL